jgi:hypothetical protein
MLLSSLIISNIFARRANAHFTLSGGDFQQHSTRARAPAAPARAREQNPDDLDKMLILMFNPCSPQSMSRLRVLFGQTAIA